MDTLAAPRKEKREDRTQVFELPRYNPAMVDFLATLTCLNRGGCDFNHSSSEMPPELAQLAGGNTRRSFSSIALGEAGADDAPGLHEVATDLPPAFVHVRIR